MTEGKECGKALLSAVTGLAQWLASMEDTTDVQMLGRRVQQGLDRFSHLSHVIDAAPQTQRRFYVEFVLQFSWIPV